jgi:hypothetical protein
MKLVTNPLLLGIAALTLYLNSFPFTLGGETLRPAFLVFSLLFCVLVVLLRKPFPDIRVYNGEALLALVLMVSVIHSIVSALFMPESVSRMKNADRYILSIGYAVQVICSLFFLIMGNVFSYIYGCKAVFKAVLGAGIFVGMFGLFQVLSDNGQVVTNIRGFFAETQFPVGYNRVPLLSVEPSIAMIELYMLAGVSLIALMKAHNLPFLVSSLFFVFLLSIGALANSTLGILLLLVFSIFYAISFERFRSRFIKYLFVVGLLFFGGFALFFIGSENIYFLRLWEVTLGVLSGDLMIEESAATRLMSISIFFNFLGSEFLFFGTGGKLFSFYFSDFLNKEFLVYPLVYDWANPLSSRLPDVKIFPFAILIENGIFIGFSVMLAFFYFVVQVYSRLHLHRMAFVMFIAISVLSSLSIGFYYFAPFWFVLGVFSFCSKAPKRY